MRHRLFLAFSEVFATHGGIQRFNQLFCRALEELAPQLDVGGRIFSLEPATSRGAAGASTWRSFSFEPCGGAGALTRKVLAACARERPRGLLVGHLGMSPTGLLCAPFLGDGFSIVVHGCEAWSVPRWTRRYAARRARFVYSVSRFTAEALTRAAAVDPSRIRILPNTIDPAMGDGPTSPPVSTSATDEIEVLSIARLERWEGRKGVDHTIEAVARLAPHHHALRLRVVGRGDDKPRLVHLAKSLGIADRVRFEEGLTDEELGDRYRRCAIFALPSSQEGFGIVFLEAMRFGRPCIGAAEGGIPEIIEDGRTGRLVPWGDVGALAEGIAGLIARPEVARAMGEAGRRRFDEVFVYPRFRERVERYLREWIVRP